MYLAIDIGGTKTLVCRMKTDGSIEQSVKFPTPENYQKFIAELTNNVAKIKTKPWALVCVAAPGSIDHASGVVKAFGNLPWQHVPLQADVTKIAGCRVLLENDAKLAGLSEARLLKPPQYKVLYLTVSTGIGGALIINNQLDMDLIDAEVGHIRFERDGKLLTWESIASGKAIVKRFGKLASEINDPAIWKIFAHDLALGIIDVAASFQPDVIIIGGGVGTHFAKYGDFVAAELQKYQDPMVKIPKVVQAKHPEEAVIYGCYQHIKDYVAQ